MKNKKLQGLSDDFFSRNEILTKELSELIEIVGGASPGTSKDKDCSKSSSDCTFNNSDTTKYRTDSTETGDTIRADDHCNEPAAQAVLDAIATYNRTSNDVISGDLMGYEGPCN